VGANAGHRIDDQIAITLVGDLTQRREILQHTGRGLGLDGEENPRLRVAPDGPRLLDIDRPAPFALDPDRLGSHPESHLVHALAKIAIDADNDLLVRLEEVGHGGLHPGAAGAGDGNGQPVVGLEDVAQQNLDLIHGLDKERIEMADERRGHRTEDSIIDRTRTRAKQNAAWRGQRRDDWCIGYGHYRTLLCWSDVGVQLMPGQRRTRSARLSLNGGRAIPFSVMIAETYRFGVTSKAGLATWMPVGARATSLTWVTSR